MGAVVERARLSGAGCCSKMVTVPWNVIEAAVAITAGLGWWWADPVGALAMLPVIVWQGSETLEEARQTTTSARSEGRSSGLEDP